ncbi:MAG: hemolysin family protein [Eubacteriaceae bacterium]|nr:hemolysin family protein [Eubacteriaceae bacterium]
MSDDPLGPKLVLQIALIALNALFAAAEIAVLSANDNRIRARAAEGDKRALKLLSLIQNPTSFLSTIQVGITLAGLLASAFAANDFSERLTLFAVEKLKISAISPRALNSVSLISITAALSFFMLIFGELVPKRIAMQKADSLARAIASPVNILTTVLKPIVFLLSIATNGILKLLRVDPNKTETEVSEEEILYMVDVADEKGAIGRDEKEMIENIFEFNNMAAQDVMIHRTDIDFINIHATDDEILELIKTTGYSRFPVYEEDPDDIKGMLMARDFLLNLATREPKPLVELLRPAYFVPESVRTDVLFKNMQREKIHMAIVVDEYGGISGLVTLEDLIEEIVGNIYDELDIVEEEQIAPQGYGIWKVPGSATLEALSEATGALIPSEGEFDTVGGLILNELTIVPTDGSMPEISVHGLDFKVLVVKDRRIEAVEVKLATDDDGED